MSPKSGLAQVLHGLRTGERGAFQLSGAYLPERCDEREQSFS